MFRNRNVVIVALLVLLVGIQAWANPLAQAAYDARIKEGDSNAKSRATTIQKAVANDKTGNPAQAAYDARIKEKDVDRTKPNNPADKIYQAVIKEQSKQADIAIALAAKFATKEASNALDTIERNLGRIPDALSPKPNNTAKDIVNAFQIAKNFKSMISTANQLKTATGATKDQLNYQMANLNLDFIERVGSIAFGNIRSNLLSAVTKGCKNVISANKIRTDDMILQSYDNTMDVYRKGQDDYKYFDLAVVLMHNNVLPDEIHATVAALKYIEKMN